MVGCTFLVTYVYGGGFMIEMLFHHAVIKWVAILLVCGGMGMFVSAAILEVPEESPYVGMRGLRRREALETNGLFGFLDPAIRWLAGWMRVFPFGSLRLQLDQYLMLAGDWFGLNPNEFLALSVMSCLGAGAAGMVLNSLFGIPAILVMFLFGIGLLLPYLNMTGEIQNRQKNVNRRLPPAIDLGALCMGAGLDFSATIKQIVSKSGMGADALNQEFEFMLHQLQLGITRQRALEQFAERIPTEAVKGFVNAVVQSEAKGSPLSEVLKIQAETMRTQRSQKGEEAASKAAAKLMIPLVFILLSVMILLMGPMILRGSSIQ